MGWANVSPKANFDGIRSQKRGFGVGGVYQSKSAKLIAVSSHPMIKILHVPISRTYIAH